MNEDYSHLLTRLITSIMICKHLTLLLNYPQMGFRTSVPRCKSHKTGSGGPSRIFPRQVSWLTIKGETGLLSLSPRVDVRLIDLADGVSCTHCVSVTGLLHRKWNIITIMKKTNNLFWNKKSPRWCLWHRSQFNTAGFFLKRTLLCTVYNHNCWGHGGV